MANLTIIILTKNEEQNLEKCIASFKGVAQRIVIIDSYSTDKTVELAKSLGAEVYEHQFENHAAQFNWALDNINLQTEWVMKVDADEEFTLELADEIDEKLDNLPAKVNGVILRRRVYFMGRWLKHGGKYPELLLRIFRVGHGMSEMKLMDEHLIVTDGDAVTFKNDFSDNNNKSLEWWINKHNWYSAFEEKQGMPYKEALEAVAAELNLSKASVTSYLPYKKGVYFRENCEREQISVVAEGLRRMRQRKKAVEALQSGHDEQHLWKCVVAFQGYRFKTISGLPFSYKIKTGQNGELTKELWIDCRESSKSLTWSSVLRAFEKTEGKPLVERPKALGDIRGVAYIYGCSIGLV